MKKVVIIIGSIALFCLLFMLGCRTLISTIANSNDCEQFNIDNVEVRTGIDIPATTQVDCMYNNGVKNVNFTLDTTKFDVEDYLQKNKFVKQNDVYINNGDRQKTAWNAIYHSKRAILAMRIVYKDEIAE